MSRKLEVRYEPSGTTAHVPAGTTLFNAAHWAGIPIESTCGGRGTCGKCKVRVLAGHAERTLADYRHVSEGLDEGWRLSCQCEVAEDMVVRRSTLDDDAEGDDDGGGALRAAGAQRGEVRAHDRGARRSTTPAAASVASPTRSRPKGSR